MKTSIAIPNPAPVQNLASGAPHVQHLTLNTADGTPLQGKQYTAQGQPRGGIVIGGATGVPQRFYRRFAEFAAQQGYTVLTVDYRGIGASRQGSLRGMQMRYMDWAEQDLAVAVETLADQMDIVGLPTWLVGHSFGGHAYGVLPNAQRLQGLYALALGAGWHGYMPKAEQLKVLVMWHGLFPLLNRWKGFSPWKMLGMGEDLPLGVFDQWRDWCRHPRYLFDDPKAARLHALYARTLPPIMAANATDDLWALPASRDAFLQGYTQTAIERRTLIPAELGGAIGHMGYFKANCQPLWTQILAWFEAQR